jgi:hypothetical protein
MKDQEALEWAGRLTSALKKWCQDNGYSAFHLLADDLGINTSSSAWRAISSGRNIVEKVDHTLYARIFLWTNLPEADPTTIPDRKYRGVAPNVQRRAWTKGRFNKWLESKEASDLNAKRHERFKDLLPLDMESTHGEMETTSMPPSDLPPSVGNFLGIQIDVLINLLANQLWQRFSPEIEDLFQKMLADNSQGGRVGVSNTGDLAKALLESLQPVIEGTPADRDRLVEQFREELRALLVKIEVLTQPREKREQSIVTIRRGGLR